jgi:CBS domain-containing protein
MKAEPKIADLAGSKRQAAVETVAAILKAKGRDVWSIGPDATVYEAIAQMAEKRAGSLVVLSEAQLAGIVTERDYARKVILQGKSSKLTPVRDIMSSPVITVTPAHTVEECACIMTQKRVRHLPVLDGGRVSGLVSIGDLVVSILSMQAHTIDQLESYITNKYPE